MKYSLLFCFLLIIFSQTTYSQCCSGGSGNPIAGGTSQGVLSTNQVELNSNFQYIYSNNFFNGSAKDTAKYFDAFISRYQYWRIAYGVTPELTMSVEAGNYFNKEQVGLNNDPERSFKSKGFGDLILFPRYKVFDYCTGKTTNEITLGMGYKIPIGKYNDSTARIEPFSGNTYYLTNPQAVQMSSGAQDFIFYAFLFRGYPAKNFRTFANLLYVKKGWNPLGEKLGDFASISLFASRTFYKQLSVTLQIRAERVNKMKLNENILLYAYPNYDPAATGYKKVFFAPQVSYSFNNITLYAMADIPVYQYLTNNQVGTKHQFTAGISYKFLATNKASQNAKGDYYCPMHPEIKSVAMDKCSKCGMDLIK